jgi:ribonuclease VapC
MSEAFVLDASAVLCLLKGEKGTDRVIEVLPRSFISAVNLSEVYAKLADAGGSEQQLAHAVGVLHLKVEPFDDDQCRDAGMLRPVTKPLGLSSEVWGEWWFGARRDGIGYAQRVRL